MSILRLWACIASCIGCGSVGLAQHLPSTDRTPQEPTGSCAHWESAAQPGHEYTSPPSIPRLSTPEWMDRASGDRSGAPLTLDVLLQLAAEHNPTIRQAQLHINGELAKAMQAGLYPNPVVSYVGEQIGLDDTAGEWQGAEIKQRFVTAGKLELSRDKYLQRAKVAEHLAVAQQFRVCNDVRIHFARSLAALQVFELRRELLKTSEDNLLTVHEMYNLGQSNQADVQRANALLQQHRLQVLKSENDVRRHLVELTALVGIDMINPLLEGSLVSDRPLIDFETAYAQLLECSPELLAAYAKLREDNITLARENVQWVPDIVVSAGSGYNFADQQTTAAARVSIDVPLFDKNQGTIRQAQADLSRQQGEIRRTQLDLRRRLAETYDTYVTAYQHVTEYEATILLARREAYRLALESYKAERAEWPDVLDAQEAYTLARVEYIDHQLMRYTNEVKIDGYLLHGGLQTPTGPLPGGHIDSVPKPR